MRGHRRASTCCRNAAQRATDLLVEMLMAVIAVFMVICGISSCRRPGTIPSRISRFCRSASTYLADPDRRLLTLLFIIEHLHHRPAGAGGDRACAACANKAGDGRSHPARHAVPLLCLGMPIAYALGSGALVGALWIGIPPEAVMLQISDGVSKVRDADHPVLRAGRRDHGRRRHGAPAGRLRQCAGRLCASAAGCRLVNILATTFLCGISGSSVADTRRSAR